MATRKSVRKSVTRAPEKTPEQLTAEREAAQATAKRERQEANAAQAALEEAQRAESEAYAAQLDLPTTVDEVLADARNTLGDAFDIAAKYSLATAGMVARRARGVERALRIPKQDRVRSFDGGELR